MSSGCNKIPKSSFGCLEMHCIRTLHNLTENMDNVCNIWSCNG